MDGHLIIREFVARSGHSFHEYEAGHFRGVFTEWTTNLKRLFAAMGRSHGFETRSSESNREFLFDLVWINRETHRMELALEAEWKRPGDVEYDFNKLLYAKSSIKLLISDLWIDAQLDDLHRRAQAELLKFKDHRAGEHYLFLNLWGKGRDGNHLCQISPECWEWRPVREGAHSAEEVQLTRIPGPPLDIVVLPPKAEAMHAASY